VQLEETNDTRHARVDNQGGFNDQGATTVSVSTFFHSHLELVLGGYALAEPIFNTNKIFQVLSGILSGASQPQRLVCIRTGLLQKRHRHNFRDDVRSLHVVPLHE
jgi:hypothetical protein